MLIGIALGLLFLLRVAIFGRVVTGPSAEGGTASSEVDER
jgi:hypothetical protein